MAGDNAYKSILSKDKTKKSGNRSNCDQNSLAGKTLPKIDPKQIELLRKEVLTGKNKNPNVVVIPEKELERMRKEAIIVTVEEQL